MFLPPSDGNFFVRIDRLLGRKREILGLPLCVLHPEAFLSCDRRTVLAPRRPPGTSPQIPAVHREFPAKQASAWKNSFLCRSQHFPRGQEVLAPYVADSQAVIELMADVLVGLARCLQPAQLA
jgi:hypothetical protein